MSKTAGNGRKTAGKTAGVKVDQNVPFLTSFKMSPFWVLAAIAEIRRDTSGGSGDGERRPVVRTRSS
jgi:hypothetical protein